MYHIRNILNQDEASNVSQVPGNLDWPEEELQTKMALGMCVEVKETCSDTQNMALTKQGRPIYTYKYSKSSLQSGQISTKFVYLKFDTFDLSSVLTSFFDVLTLTGTTFSRKEMKRAALLLSGK